MLFRSQGKSGGDRYVTDCVRHHPVSHDLTVRCTLPNSSDSSVACVVCSAQFQSHPRLCRCHFACNFGAVSGPRKHFPRFSFPIRRDWFVSGERRVRQFLACGSRCSNESSWAPHVTSHESLRSSAASAETDMLPLQNPVSRKIGYLGDT